MLIASPAVEAAVTVARAELNAGRLRVDGQGAAPSAPISIDGVVRGTADAAGSFRIDVSGFSSASCRVTVGDGAGSAQVTLTGCTPVPLGKPTFALMTSNGAVGQALHYAAAGLGSEGVAFVYSWGDGTQLRDPFSGFYAVDSSGAVHGADVTHAWTAAGGYAVTVTAVDPSGASVASDPIVVTVSGPVQQSDCGSGEDAGGSAGTALALTLPASCSARLAADNLDSADAYRFSFAQPFRLLTLTIAAPGLTPALVDPNGVVRGDVSAHTLCAAPQVLCSTAATPPVETAIDYTLDAVGEWKLLFSGNVNLDYSFALHAGGGGDDCVQGRSPSLAAPAPMDAPNQGFSIRLLDAGEAGCTGSLPFADRDFTDSYSFPVLLGEPVALSLVSTDGFAPCSGRLWASLVVPGVRGPSFPFGCVGDRLFNPGGSGTAFIDLQAAWQARTETLGHRLRVATGSRHVGDCFTGTDAGDSPGTATAMPVSVCVGDVGSADPDDWYGIPVSTGQEIAVTAVPCGCALGVAGPVQPILPLELYDPSGALRQASPQASPPVIADAPGVWKLRVATDAASVPHYEGSYGIQVTLTQLGLVSVGIDPASVGGGGASQGAVFMNTEPARPVTVSLTSSNPAVAQVPSSVTVQAGSVVGGFPVTTSPVGASTTVTISASVFGTTRTTTLTVTPSGQADSVVVTRAG